MAHYAMLDEHDNVLYTFTGCDEDNLEQDWEKFYLNFHKKNTDNKIVDCKRTSYNAFKGINKLTGEKAFRGNYGGPGVVYNRQHDAFTPQPPKFKSWILNTTTFYYDPPVPVPDDFAEKFYIWDEEQLNWVCVGDREPAGSESLRTVSRRTT